MIEQHPVLLKQLHGICKQLDAQAVQIVAGDGMRFCAIWQIVNLVVSM